LHALCIDRGQEPSVRIPTWWWRRAANLANGSTLIGLALARLAGTSRSPGPRGLVLAGRARLLLPGASAVTVGDVVLTRHPASWLLERPRLLTHEERHAWQYAACLGLPMLPAYGVLAAWSWLRTGNPGSRNLFERLAGLADGGYPEISRRPPRAAQRRPHHPPTA
jgi:hypothetical protein